MTPPATGAAHAPRTIPRPGPAPRVPRRVSGPARRPTAAARPAPTAARRRLGALIDAPLLDRLMRGPAWIVVIGVLLMGLVATQVSLLRLNAGIGRAVQASSTLQRQNAALRDSVSRLGTVDRIQARAARLGMVMPAPKDVRYRAARRVDPRLALLAMRAPEAAPQVAAVPAAPPPATTAAVPQPTAAPTPPAQSTTVAAAPPPAVGAAAVPGGQG